MKYLVKQMCLVLLLLGTLLMLWEIPHYQQNAMSHSELVPIIGNKLPSYEIQTFLRHIETRLPYYREEFEQAEKSTGVPWTLLASVAYQESKWNRHAVSPTGVRGLMMLTRSTASDLGIQNRLDPAKSISGGARYLSYLHKRVPSEIRMPDRMFVALAAYNVGFGHMKDARLLAEQLGKDSSKWEDLKEVLPLLSKKEYYQTLPHRYARGWEPVQYVKRIRAYRKILQQIIDREPKPSKVEV
ncbi:MAG: transglycosylase SLT domain-containing protein [Nitrospira sp.]|nr:transglycosylase SLT domain-containing protein [Nitrospira sp.]HQU28002.1 transglycosylase SLT domain-containing protein [Nitrospirales bacterium]